MTKFKSYQKQLQTYQSEKLHQVTQERDMLQARYEAADSWRFIWKILFIMSFAYIAGDSIGGWL
jgi:hypothetical protein